MNHSSRLPRSSRQERSTRLTLLRLLSCFLRSAEKYSHSVRARILSSAPFVSHTFVLVVAIPFYHSYSAAAIFLRASRRSLLSSAGVWIPVLSHRIPPFDFYNAQHCCGRRLSLRDGPAVARSVEGAEDSEERWNRGYRALTLTLTNGFYCVDTE